ncbi:MAG: hypothetical protein SFY68_10580 [Candidatus Sumerlaeia bacterium]|nr:hypothetical protein [Candidatus Sumerlaeia bacterium]
MIEINLLPQEQLSKAPKSAGTGGSSQYSLLIAALLLLLYGGAFGLGVYYYTDLLTQQSTAARLKTQADELAKTVKEKEEEFKDVSTQLEALRSQVALLNALDPKEGRLFWAEKLNLLPSFVPEGVFLTNIKVTEDVRMKETPESLAAFEAWRKLPVKTRPKEPPKKQFTPEIRYRLNMNGVAYVEDGTDDQLVELVVAFHSKIKSDKVAVPFSGEEKPFMENFRETISISPLTRKTMDNRSVYEFRFDFETIPAKVPTKL